MGVIVNMNKRAASILILSIFMLTTFFGHVVKAENRFDIYNFKLEVSSKFKEFSEDSNINGKSPIIYGNEKKVGYSSEKKAWLNLQLKVDKNSKGNELYVEGNSVLHVENDTYPISASGELKKYTLIDGYNVYYGPLMGTIKNKNGEEQSIIGLYLDLNKNISIASVSIGTIGPEYPGLIQFGEYNEDFKYVLAEFNNNIDSSAIIKSNLDKPESLLTDTEKSSIESASLVESAVMNASTSSLGDYKYKTSRSSIWISSQNGYWWYDQAPPNSQILGQTDYYMIIMDVFRCTNNTSVINRVWSNTSGLKSYLTSTRTGDPYVGAYAIYSWFGSSSPNIHINTSGPAEGSGVSLPTWLSFVASYIKYADTIVQILDYYFTNTVTVGNVSSITKVDAGRTYKKGKYVRYVDKQADLRSQPTDLENNARNKGGLVFNFDFLSYGSNKSLESGAQIVYSANAGVYYSGFFWSDKVYYYWTE